MERRRWRQSLDWARRLAPSPASHRHAEPIPSPVRRCIVGVRPARAGRALGAIGQPGAAVVDAAIRRRPRVARGAAPAAWGTRAGPGRRRARRPDSTSGSPGARRAGARIPAARTWGERPRRGADSAVRHLPWRAAGGCRQRGGGDPRRWFDHRVSADRRWRHLDRAAGAPGRAERWTFAAHRLPRRRQRGAAVAVWRAGTGTADATGRWRRCGLRM